MPGRLVDLANPEVRLPNRIVVDTNLLVARRRVSIHPPHPDAETRAAQFFNLLETSGAVGLVTATSVAEFFHAALRAAYQQAVPAHRDALTRALPRKHRFSWDDLYKLRPDLIAQFSPELDRLRAALLETGLVCLQPDDLARLPTALRFEDALLALVPRYRLDTADAAILLDAQRAGVSSIASLDADMRRAKADFDVYTWL